MNTIYKIFLTFMCGLSTATAGSDKLEIAPDWLGDSTVTLTTVPIHDYIQDMANPTPVSLTLGVNQRATNQILFVKMTSQDELSYCITQVHSKEFKFTTNELLRPNTQSWDLRYGFPTTSQSMLVAYQHATIKSIFTLSLNKCILRSDDDLFFSSPQVSCENLHIEAFTFVEFQAPNNLRRNKGLEKIRIYPSSKKYLCILKDLQINFAPDQFNLSIEGVNIGLLKLYFTPDQGIRAA